MSNTAVEYVLDHSQHTGNRLLLMVIIAAHMHPNGTGAYPSLDRLAAKSKLGRRTVQRYLDTLEGSGELEITRRGFGPGNSNLYAFPGLRALEEAKPKTGPKRGQNGANNGGIRANPRTKSHSNLLNYGNYRSVTEQKSVQGGTDSTQHPQSPTPTEPNPGDREAQRTAAVRRFYPERRNKAGEPMCSLKGCINLRAPGDKAWFCLAHGEPSHNYAIIRVH